MKKIYLFLLMTSIVAAYIYAEEKEICAIGDQLTNVNNTGDCQAVCNAMSTVNHKKYKHKFDAQWCKVDCTYCKQGSLRANFNSGQYDCSSETEKRTLYGTQCQDCPDEHLTGLELMDYKTAKGKSCCCIPE